MFGNLHSGQDTAAELIITLTCERLRGISVRYDSGLIGYLSRYSTMHNNFFLLLAGYSRDDNVRTGSTQWLDSNHKRFLNMRIIDFSRANQCAHLVGLTVQVGGSL